MTKEDSLYMNLSGGVQGVVLACAPVNYLLQMSVKYIAVGSKHESSPPLLLSLSAQTSPVFPQF